MRRNRFAPAAVLVLVAALLPALVMAAAPAAAQSQALQGIVVIDTQEIYREAIAVKGLQQHIDAQRSAYQDELRKEEESLRAADQELARQRTILSQQAFAEKRRELEERVATLRREIQTRKRGLERLFAQGMNQVQKALVDISQDIAAERNVELVIEKSAVVLVKPELEITREALERLNDKLPAVNLAMPQN